MYYNVQDLNEVLNLQPKSIYCGIKLIDTGNVMLLIAPVWFVF